MWQKRKTEQQALNDWIATLAKDVEKGKVWFDNLDRRWQFYITRYWRHNNKNFSREG